MGAAGTERGGYAPVESSAGIDFAACALLCHRRQNSLFRIPMLVSVQWKVQGGSPGPEGPGPGRHYYRSMGSMMGMRKQAEPTPLLW